METDPFAEYTAAERESLSEWVTGPLRGVLSVSPIVDILAVLCGEKPGAYVVAIMDIESERPIVGFEFTDTDIDVLGEFCDEFGLAYRRESAEWNTKSVYGTQTEEWEEPIEVDTIRHCYYISTDSDRVDSLSEDPGDEELGRFLGFPEDAITAFASNTSRGKHYRTHVRSIYARDVPHPATMDYIYYRATGYAANPTVDGFRQALADGERNIELRKAFDEALDANNQFSLHFYENMASQNAYPYNSPLLLWWLLYYRIRHELRSDPKFAAWKLKRYIRARVEQLVGN